VSKSEPIRQEYGETSPYYSSQDGAAVEFTSDNNYRYSQLQRREADLAKKVEGGSGYSYAEKNELNTVRAEMKELREKNEKYPGSQSLAAAPGSEAKSIPPSPTAGNASDPLRDSEGAEYNRPMAEGGKRELGARRKAQREYANNKGIGAAGANAGPDYTEVKKDKGDLVTSEDKCAFSGSYDGKWTCDSTESLGTAAQVSNQVTQMVGATMTQVQGMKNAAEASASGTQSGAYNAAAKSAEQTANIETATGLINTGFGAALVTMAVQHNQNAKKAAAAAKSRVTVDQQTGNVVPSAGERARQAVE